jgi:hypothetical protein
MHIHQVTDICPRPFCRLLRAQVLGLPVPRVERSPNRYAPTYAERHPRQSHELEMAAAAR